MDLKLWVLVFSSTLIGTNPADAIVFGLSLHKTRDACLSAMTKINTAETEIRGLYGCLTVGEMESRGKEMRWL